MVGAQFKARNIDFILNDIVESFPESDSGEVVLKSGQKVQADLIVSRSPLGHSPLALTPVVDQVRTSGPRPNTDILASSLGADILTEGKFVHVSPQLQVFGHPSVFAAGDIIDWPEEKQFGKTVGQAAVVAANIVSYLTNKPLTKEYTGGFEAIILTNGKVRVSAPHSRSWSCLTSSIPTSVIRRRVPAFPVGACLRTLVCPNGQVENAPAWTCAFQDGPVRIQTQYS